MYKELIESCIEKKITIAVAESCTGGGLGKKLTAVPGASAVFKGGLICYSNEIKRDLLSVPEVILESEGAVSAACAESMVMGVRKLFKSDVAVAITGIAGPSGATDQKPVGLVFICAETEEALLSKGLLFKGDRESVRDQAVEAAGAMLCKIIGPDSLLEA